MSSLIRSPVPSIISETHFYVSGNVMIHPSAVIAPGVLLQADPDSELVLAAGVCIGVGCVLHAHQGVLEIGTGATLGSNVLIVGQGRIGANACIGAMTTIINTSVLPQQMVPPGSLLGDGSRQVIVVEDSEPAHAPQFIPPQSAPAARSPHPTSKTASDAPAQSEDASAEVRVVYGRAYLERMMVTMFPHRQATQGE